MKKFYLLWGFVLLGMELWAQGLSLKQYRDEVLQYNQQVQQSKETVLQAWLTLKEVRTVFFPGLDAAANYSYQPETVELFSGTALKHDNYGVEADLVQKVYSGSGVRKQYEIAKLQYAVSQWMAEHTVENMVYVADVAYWTVVAHRDLLNLSNEYVLLIKELFAVIHKRFVEGVIGRTDVLMVENRLKEAEIQQSSAILNYKVSLQSLNVMRGHMPDEPVLLTDSIQQMVVLPKRELLEEVLKQRSDYQVAVMNVEVAKMQTLLNRSRFLPQVLLGVKERFGTTMLNVDGISKWTTTFYAQINIPLYHWGAKQKEVERGRTQERSRELERSRLQDEVMQELSHAWTNVTETARRLEIVYSSLEIARNNLNLNTFSYNEGKLPVLDVLSAQVSWLQAYTNVVSVNYQHKIALSEYAKVCGNSFEK